MQYSSRIFVAALLILSAAQAGFKALALPLPTLVAQASTTFPVPENVPSDTTLAIQSSPNLGIAAQALKQSFETTYEGTQVGVEVTSSDQALQALQDGDIDLAAIGRPLTEAEVAAGLFTVPLERTKIAVIVGPNNPFNGNLTFEQFAGMFRGEITDWSQVGGTPGPIRFVDRPEISDTRRSLSQYEVFRTAPFVNGATTETVADDDTATVIEALGNDGISYAIAPHVLEQPGVKIVSMHQTLPDDPRYPYSQPRYFVYKGQPSAAIAAFLGYVASPAATEALAAARQAEAGAVATSVGSTAAVPSAATPEATTGATTEAAPATEAEPAAGATPDGATQPAAEPDPAAIADPAATSAGSEARGGFAWWWLLPLAAGAGALAWALGRRGGSAPVPPAAMGATPAVAPPPPEPLAAPAAAASTPVIEPPVVAPPVVEPPPVVPPAAVMAVEEVPPAALPDPVVAPAALPDPVVAPTPMPEPELAPAVAAVPPVEPAPPITPVPAIEPEPTIPQPSAVPVMAVAAGAAGLAAGAAAILASTEDQSAVEASKFNVVGHPADGDLDLSTIDDGLPSLPDGYGDSRIVLMPRDPQWAYTYWDTPHIHKEDLRRQGGERLALRLYDVTDMDMAYQAPHSMQQFDCDELARDWYLPIPLSDRDYQVEIGYLAGDGRWLVLARSNTIRIPPVYPSDWSEDHFMTVTWEEELRGKTLITLVDPNHKIGHLHETMYAISQPAEWERMAGSIFGSMQHVPGSGQQVAGSIQHVAGSVQHVAGSVQHVAGSVQHVAGSIQHIAGYAGSSYMLASGAGLAGAYGALPTVSGAVPTMSGVGMMNVSGLTMSGISGLTLSGVGFSASMPPARPRKFWLVADAELIVYGATEPDATVTIGGQPIQLSPEGTFRVQTSFPDGRIDYPIMAVAVDGEQNRSIHLSFERQTPERRTNTRDEAQEEWF